jgi:hypothetical protein
MKKLFIICFIFVGLVGMVGCARMLYEGEVQEREYTYIDCFCGLEYWAGNENPGWIVSAWDGEKDEIIYFQVPEKLECEPGEIIISRVVFDLDHPGGQLIWIGKKEKL